jgi:hypothetical protein
MLFREQLFNRLNNNLANGVEAINEILNSGINVS